MLPRVLFRHEQSPFWAQRFGEYRAAVSLVELAVVIAILGVLLTLTLSAVQRIRALAARATCANQLRQMGMALHRYHGQNDSFPPGVMPHAPVPRPGASETKSKIDYPLLNWHARLLPFVEQESLWAETVKAYATDWHEINTPPHNGYVTAVPLYLCSLYKGLPGMETFPAATSYLGVSGTNEYKKNGVLYLASKVRFADITDGSSHTVAVGERPPSVNGYYGRWYGGWGHWGVANAYLGVRETDVAHWNGDCPRGSYHFTAGQIKDDCSIFHFWSLHPGGANFMMADGSVRFLSYSADGILPALATRAGGEPAPALD